VPYALARPSLPTPDVLERALEARDPRFDGIFFVGITTTMVYCRPTCPARVSYTNRRRFFDSAASAERAGFRPCLRCRPELAPGRAPMDAVPRLARVAADRIGAGALNGHCVAQLARELGVSERHLRRALEREVGVSPIELAQTHRLLLAKRLLADTSLSVTRIAFASGFQSLRRFNSVFLERYRLCPSAVRRGQLTRGGARRASPAPLSDLIPLTLAYRPPLAWAALLRLLGDDALPGVELVSGTRYARSLAMTGERGVIFAEDASGLRGPLARNHVNVWVSASLLPVLMQLLTRLRRLFDLDAEPTVVDAHLTQGGLGELVRRTPGLRIPGALDGFEAAFRLLLRDSAGSPLGSTELVRRVVWALGEPLDTGVSGLTSLSPTADRVAEAGTLRLVALGVPRPRASIISAVARAVASRRLDLDPGGSTAAARRVLREVDGVGGRFASAIVMRAMYSPDAFPTPDPVLQRAAGVASTGELRARSEAWRPWRAYAALHLALSEFVPDPVR
jgi:AraC family transcriptional regulator, regulatory protein of adaptative response / DNA-3-methyladenine glycosylase II